MPDGWFQADVDAAFEEVQGWNEGLNRGIKVDERKEKILQNGRSEKPLENSVDAQAGHSRDLKPAAE